MWTCLALKRVGFSRVEADPQSNVVCSAHYWTKSIAIPVLCSSDTLAVARSSAWVSQEQVTYLAVLPTELMRFLRKAIQILSEMRSQTASSALYFQVP